MHKAQLTSLTPQQLLQAKEQRQQGSSLLTSRPLTPFGMMRKSWRPTRFWVELNTAWSVPTSCSPPPAAAACSAAWCSLQCSRSERGNSAHELRGSLNSCVAGGSQDAAGVLPACGGLEQVIHSSQGGRQQCAAGTKGCHGQGGAPRPRHNEQWCGAGATTVPLPLAPGDALTCCGWAGSSRTARRGQSRGPTARSRRRQGQRPRSLRSPAGRAACIQGTRAGSGVQGQ